MCVSAPEAINDYVFTCNKALITSVQQVLLLFSFFRSHLPSILLMGVTLVAKCIVSYCQRRLRYVHITLYLSFHSKRHFASCSIQYVLTRQSISVIKGVCHVGSEVFERRLAYSVTVEILAKTTSYFKNFYHKSTYTYTGV